MKKIYLLLLASAVVLSLNSCGGSGTSHVDKVGVTTLALFEYTGPTAKLEQKASFATSLLNLFVSDAHACAFSVDHSVSAAPPQTCFSLGEFPKGVVKAADVTPGTYGASGNQVTVAADETCASDMLNPNAFASFSISSQEVSCTSSSTGDSKVVMEEGSGVWRNNLGNNTTEFYGTFKIQSGDQTSSAVNCSFAIADPNNSGSGRITGTCEDGSGTTIDQSTDASCSL